MRGWHQADVGLVGVMREIRSEQPEIDMPVRKNASAGGSTYRMMLYERTAFGPFA